jgi:hypothetical protein
MKLVYAKMWLDKYIKYNREKFDEKTFSHKLNWEIVNLSHRVYKRHGLRGHESRQNIRKKLWIYCENKYGISKYRRSMLSRIIDYIKRLW